MATAEQLRTFKQAKDVFESKLTPNDQASVIRICLNRHVDPIPAADVKWASRALFVALYDPKISEQVLELVLSLGRETETTGRETE